MIINLNKILGTFLTFIFISLSFIFFQLGYYELKYKKSVNLIIIDDIKKNELKENKIDDKLVEELFSIEEDIEPSIPIEKKITIIVKQNDTFVKLIKPYITNNQTKQKIISLISNEFNLRKLNVGQKIFLYISNINNNNEISKIVIPLNFNTDLIVEKNYDTNYFSINKVNLPLTTYLEAQKYTILTSLFQDGQTAKVPLEILVKIIKLYSFDIDFQRDIRKGNQLEILYRVFYNEKRNAIAYREIEYANLILEKNDLEYFLFKTSEGFSDYFNKEGKNVRKTLMKTPLDGARISSSFGMRKHPILGYNKKHQGVDFSAPKGTPVYAAGNGIIEYVGRNGGYGKYIRIRHNSSYKTAYAHLNNFNKGISNNSRVNQGQTIGYVGSSGNSTGSHLHYEIIYQGKHINPMKMKLPGKALKEKELMRFKESSNIIYSNFLFYLFE